MQILVSLALFVATFLKQSLQTFSEILWISQKCIHVFGKKFSESLHFCQHFYEISSAASNFTQTLWGGGWLWRSDRNRESWPRSTVCLSLLWICYLKINNPLVMEPICQTQLIGIDQVLGYPLQNPDLLLKAQDEVFKFK